MGGEMAYRRLHPFVKEDILKQTIKRPPRMSRGEQIRRKNAELNKPKPKQTRRRRKPAAKPTTPKPAAKPAAASRTRAPRATARAPQARGCPQGKHSHPHIQGCHSINDWHRSRDARAQSGHPYKVDDPNPKRATRTSAAKKEESKPTPAQETKPKQTRRRRVRKPAEQPKAGVGEQLRGTVGRPKATQTTGEAPRRQLVTYDDSQSIF